MNIKSSGVDDYKVILEGEDSVISYLVTLITNPKTPDNIRQDAFLVLGVAASCEIRPAAQAFKNLIFLPSTSEVLSKAAVRALSSKGSKRIFPTLQLIEDLFTSKDTSDNVKKKAWEILECMAFWWINPAIQTFERLMPVFKNYITDLHNCDELRKLSLTGMIIAARLSEIGREELEKFLPVLEKLIIDIDASEGIKSEAIGGMSYLSFRRNSLSATQMLKKIMPVLINLITDTQSSDILKQNALSAIRVVGIVDIEWARYSSEIERLVPILENLIYSGDSATSRAAFWALLPLSVHNNQSPLHAMERLVSVFEDFVINPRIHGDDLKRKALRLFGNKEDNFINGAIRGLNLMISNKLQPAIQALERLIPALERFINNSKVADSFTQDCIGLLGVAASFDIQAAIDTIEKIMPDLENFIAQPEFPCSAKQKTIDAISAGLPLQIKGPKLEFSESTCPLISINEVLQRVSSPCNPKFTARSLIYGLLENKILVIKILKERQKPSSLLREAYWMRYLNELKERGCFEGVRFDLPEIIQFSDSCVIKLKDIPIQIPEGVSLHPERYSLCFTIHRDYFSYPNETLPERMLSIQDFQEVINRCAYLLARLISLGIIHTDPIPLFHTTLELDREDGGRFCWWRRGNLERWLTSSDYPNIGKTGIRDFEHFISWNIDKPPAGYEERSGLFRFIGTHLLSLILITGSYFRNRDRNRVGFDSEGNYIDAQDLFDRLAFKQIIQNIFLEYYRGFTGEIYRGYLPLDLDILSQKMIQKMGRDECMEQMLTSKDQTIMSDKEVKELLISSGYSEEELKNFERGKRNTLVLTGPHLGELWTENFSEFIDSIEIMTCLCVLKYKKLRKQNR